MIASRRSGAAFAGNVGTFAPRGRASRGNKAWGRHDAASAEDTEKEQKANELLDAFHKKHGRAGTMAEVFCDVLKVDPLGAKKSSTQRVRNLGAAFPREGVEAEVERILRAHLGALPLLDERFIEAVMRESGVVILPTPALDSRQSPHFPGRILPSDSLTTVPQESVFRPRNPST